MVHRMSQRIVVIEKEWPLEGGTWSARRVSGKQVKQFFFEDSNLILSTDERDLYSSFKTSFTHLPVVAEDG